MILALAEFPLNAVAFRTAGAPELMTYVMTSTLALVLPLCAHFLGVFLRHQTFSKREYALISLNIVLPVGAIAGVAYFRDKYIGEVQKVLGIEMDAMMVALIFIVINLVIYLGAVLASYFAHDPEIAKCKEKLREASKRLRQARAQLAAAQRVFSQAEQRYNAITAMRQNAFFDLSGSTQLQEVRQKYYDNFQKVSDGVNQGDLIVADAITDNPLAQSSFPVNDEFEKFDPTSQNRLVYEGEVKKKKEAILTKVKQVLFDQSRKVPSTKIMDALQLAERVFKSVSEK
ncbi:MAG: hypothetical protein HY314_08285 [Acidobacteria bacterium]|nr:hypothetical protein [Acidobacteriota bacterium]